MFFLFVALVLLIMLAMYAWDLRAENYASGRLTEELRTRTYALLQKVDALNESAANAKADSTDLSNELEVLYNENAVLSDKVGDEAARRYEAEEQVASLRKELQEEEIRASEYDIAHTCLYAELEAVLTELNDTKAQVETLTLETYELMAANEALMSSPRPTTRGKRKKKA